MILEDQTREFFVNNPLNIHVYPENPENLNGAYYIFSYLASGGLRLGIYHNKFRALEVYEEIKAHLIKRKKYYAMPKE